MYPFDLVQPKTLSEAVEALTAADAQLLSGGQTLLPSLKQRLNAPAVLVSLTGIDDLSGVQRDGDTLVIGAATPHAEVAARAAQHYPALAILAARIGDPAVRNRGTLGGSLANNDPSACYPAAVLASGATLITNTREIPADEFFRGLFTTCLEDDEILTAVRFPIPDKAGYAKFQQPASRFALTGAFVAQSGTDVRVAVTGASESGIFRWRDAEAALTTLFDPSALTELNMPQDGLIGDLHATPAYRAHLVSVMTRRAVLSAM